MIAFGKGSRLDLPPGIMPGAPTFSAPPVISAATDAELVYSIGHKHPPGTRVGQFSSETLPLAGDFDAFARAMTVAVGPAANDLRIVHNGESVVRAMPRGYRRGETLFGDGTSSGDPIFQLNRTRMRLAQTLLLHDAVYSPQSATVFQDDKGFYDGSLVNYGEGPDRFDTLVAMDPLYDYDAEKHVCLSENAKPLRRIERLAMPICGTGFHNYGHFLFDGLPIAHLMKVLFPNIFITLVGPRLAGYQQEILAALGLADRYLALEEPAIFSRLIVSNLMAQHVSYPGRLIRPMADAIRFKLATPATRNRRVFISRRSDIQKRVMTNRPETEALLTMLGFEIITPEAMPFAAQVKLFAECEIVVGESGAGMANVIFCDPGTKILEIQPENFFEGWIRATSMVLALEWNVFFARSDHQPNAERAFQIDIDSLRSAVEAVIAL